MTDCRSRAAALSGFSLIEVTLTLGIVALGLISIIGAYASLQFRSSEIDLRDDANFAVSSIQNYLQEQEEFGTIFDNIRDGGLELVFFHYRGAGPDQPDVHADNLYAFCAKIDSEWKDWEAARDGKLFRAVFTLDETVNPVTKAELGGSVDQYPHGYLALQLALHDGYGFDQAMNPPATSRPILTTPVAVTR